MKTKHPEEYEFVKGKRGKKFKKANDGLVQQTLHGFKTKSIIKDFCLDIVIASGRPYNIFNNAGMKGIIGLAKKAENEDVSVTPREMKNYTLQKSAAAKEKLKQTFKGKLINVTVDLATCNMKSFFGKNLKY